MTEPTLADVDVDGAITDAVAAVHGTTRAEFFRRAALGSVMLLGASAAPAEARPTDESILNYSLSLEYVQDSFYAEVLRLGTLKKGKMREQARVVGAHEHAHVIALRKALEGHAIARPRFDFRGATEDAERYLKTAVAFEDLSVAAYKAQIPLIEEREYLVPALAIHTVEARHAAWMRRLAGFVPAAHAFDEPRSKASTLKIVDRTQFFVKTGSTTRPRMTG